MNYDEKIKLIDALITQVSINDRLGEIRWSVRGPRRTLGKIAGSIISSGYRSVWFSGHRIQYHQIIFYSAHGYIPHDGRVVDHIDRNKLNNKVNNLRDLSLCENARNANTSKNSTSGRTGVHYVKLNKKWSAHIYFDGKRKHLGLFNEFNDAVSAREAAEVDLMNKQ